MNDYRYRESQPRNRNQDYPVREIIPGLYYPPAPALTPESPPKTWHDNIRDFINLILLLSSYTDGFGFYSHIRAQYPDILRICSAGYVFLVMLCGMIFKERLKTYNGFLKKLVWIPNFESEKFNFKGARIIRGILYYSIFLASIVYIIWYLINLPMF